MCKRLTYVRILDRIVLFRGKIIDQIIIGLVLNVEQLLYIKTNIVSIRMCSIVLNKTTLGINGLIPQVTIGALLTKRQFNCIVKLIRNRRVRLVITELMVVKRALVKALLAIVLY